jgi:membrane protease YdiL (CAAX protease family)
MTKVYFLILLSAAGLILGGVPILVYLLISQQLIFKPNIGFNFILKILAGCIFEELLFRIIILKLMVIFFKKKSIAVFIQSLIFALFHNNSYASFIAFFGYLLAGIYYSTFFLFFHSLIKTKPSFFYLLIIFPIGIHFSWNFIQYLQFTTNDFSFEKSWESMVCRIIILISSFYFLAITKKTYFR